MRLAAFVSAGVVSARRYACVITLGAVVATAAHAALLPSSPQGYLDQATRERQSADRSWVPQEGQLGNLRHLQINAPHCTVRVIGGDDNRVIAGTSDVVVVEKSRVLDGTPDLTPVPRDVVLATDRAHACPAVGSCGLSLTGLPALASRGVCFTVQVATAQELLLGGDDLTVLADRVRGPALRVDFNPGANQRLWFEAAALGLLSISANSAARVGGNGNIDFLGASSSNGASAMFLHEFDARHVAISTTTTGTRWSIRIGADTEASYYQPARAAGPLAENYPIEIDGPIARLAVPSQHVAPYPIAAETREAARSLGATVRGLAGPPPVFAVVAPPPAVGAPAQDPRERVAAVVARSVAPGVRITNLALWKGGGRVEGVTPTGVTYTDIQQQLDRSGEFIYVSTRGAPQQTGGTSFAALLTFSCVSPGMQSTCPAGDPAANDAYSEAQVRALVEAALGAEVTLRRVTLRDGTIDVDANAPTEAAAKAALARLGHASGMFRMSRSGYRQSGNAPTDFEARMMLVCAVPPRPDGICTPQPVILP